MDPRPARTADQPTGESGEKLFTVAEANSALVLVRKITAELVSKYKHLLALRDERHELAMSAGTAGQLEALNTRIEQITEALNRLHAELNEIGCVLKDWSDGLADFPALHRGRKVWLCWRLGEPAVAHWHDLHSGYASRQPIGTDFE